MTDQEIMAQFESLGENCEFGIAQRMAGIDPFGLFRFANTPAAILLKLLHGRFAGLGSAENTYLWDRQGEWMVADRIYEWSMHTWKILARFTHDDLLPTEMKRLTYLRDRMLDLLAEGDRIFVIVGCSEDHARTALDALRAYSPTNRLLHVCEGDLGCEFEDGLIRGHIPSFAPRATVAKDTDGAAWLALCRAVLHQNAGM